MIERLKRRADFQRLTRARRSFAARGLVLQADALRIAGTEIKANDGIPEPMNHPALRIGFTASKKVGGAVQRNRAKRRLRALAEEVLPVHAMPAHDYVLIARAATIDRPYARLRGDLEYALKKMKLWRPDN